LHAAASRAAIRTSDASRGCRTPSG
jgi:hypothetical protein